MPKITRTTRLERVEHIIGSGVGILDFAVEGEDGYYTWNGNEDADWTVEDVDRVENIEEDRLIMYPKSQYFTCEIGASAEEANSGPVRCWCD